MAIRMGVGKSAAIEADKAAAEAVAMALGGGGPRPALALVFCTDQYDPEALARALTRELGDIPWAGCSTAGVFVGAEMLTQGLVVGTLAPGGLHFGVGVGGPVSSDGRAAGRQAVSQALAALPPPDRLASRALILLPDALTGNAADVVRGAVEEAGTGLTWAGGGAGDNLRFIRTTQFAGGKPLQDHIVAVALQADKPFGAGIRHGWRPYGPPHMVTRTDGATASELDFEQAFGVYRRVAAEQGDEVTREGFAKFAMTHPLGIPQADGEHVIRDPLAVDDDGGLRCVAEVPDGALVRVMQGDREALLAAAAEAARTARESAAGALGGAIVFDCVSRCMMLGRDITEEFAAFQANLGADVPLIGCLTFGEVGALGRGVPQFHNKTAVVLAVPE